MGAVVYRPEQDGHGNRKGKRDAKFPQSQKHTGTPNRGFGLPQQQAVEYAAEQIGNSGYKHRAEKTVGYGTLHQQG